MIVRLVQEIRAALRNKLYFVALSSALTLPDICGKVAYPTERSTRKRYVLWYDEVTSHLPQIDMEKVFAELAKSDNELYQGRKMEKNESDR